MQRGEWEARTHTHTHTHTNTHTHARSRTSTKLVNFWSREVIMRWISASIFRFSGSSIGMYLWVVGRVREEENGVGRAVLEG